MRVLPRGCPSTDNIGDGRDELGRRERAVAQVQDEQPRAQPVDHVVQAVGVRDAVDGGVQGEGEGEDVGDVADTVEITIVSIGGDVRRVLSC